MAFKLANSNYIILTDLLKHKCHKCKTKLDFLRQGDRKSKIIFEINHYSLSHLFSGHFPPYNPLLPQEQPHNQCHDNTN
jgi:hypothetical protein